MKKFTLLLIILSIMTLPMLAEEENESPWSLYTEIDMYLGFKTGIKYKLNHNWDFVNTFGVNMIGQSQYVYSLYGSYHTMTSYDNFFVDVNMGILQGVLDLTSWDSDHYIYVNPGIAMHLSYPIIDKVRIGAQGGMIFMIGYDRSTWAFSLEPYAGITLTLGE